MPAFRGPRRPGPRRATAIVAWVLVHALAAAPGCKRQQPEPAATAVAAPPEVVPERIDPEIAAQLERLLGAARAAPGDAAARAALGMAYEVAGLTATAALCYEQAARLDPAEPRYAYYLALVLAAQGDVTGAIESVDRTLALDDSYVPAYLYRGQWLLDLGRVDDAREAYRRATVLDRASDAAWIGLARTHLKLGEPGRAVAILEDVVRRNRHPQVYQLLGLAYRDSGDLDRARLALAEGRPGPPPGWPDPWNRAKLGYMAGFGAGLRRAEVLLARGQAQQAIELLESLRADHPDDLALLNNLSVAYGQTGRQDLALDVLRHGLLRHPDYFPFHLNIANRYHQQGDIDAALRHLEQAIALNPTLGWAWRQQAGYLEEIGRKADALRSWDRALDLDASNASWFLAAAGLAAQMRAWDRCGERARQAVDLDPGSQEGWLMLARVHVESGDAPGAREALDRAARLGADPARVEALSARLDNKR